MRCTFSAVIIAVMIASAASGLYAADRLDANLPLKEVFIEANRLFEQQTGTRVAAAWFNPGAPLEKYYVPNTPVKIVYNAGRADSKKILTTTLAHLPAAISAEKERFPGLIYIGNDL